MTSATTPAPAKTDKPGQLERRPHESLVSRIQQHAALQTDSDLAWTLASQALDKIAAATSLDELFEANEQSTLPDIADYLNQPLTLLELNFNKSREEFKKNGVGSYAYIKAMLDSGEIVETTTGAANVVGSLFKIAFDLDLLNPASKTKPRVKVIGVGTGNGTLYKLAKP